MQRILLLLGVLISVMNTFADPVDDAVKNVMNAHQIPGLVLQVVQHGQTIKTAAYGHFGRTDVEFPWEKLDKVEALKKEAAARIGKVKPAKKK